MAFERRGPSGHEYDVVIIGAGLLGLATAHQLLLQQPRLRLAVLEKEAQLGAHQSGHNSGVLHTGIYYKPGSLKARLCQEGRRAMLDFCRAENIAHELCGKVIVATDPQELPQLELLLTRAERNTVKCERLDEQALRSVEPHAHGIAALHVPEAGIVDFRQVLERLHQRVRSQGGQVRCSARVTDVAMVHGRLLIESTAGRVRARYLISCGGLQSDRLAALTGARVPAQIVPFRGEYYQLRADLAERVRGLIYPVPDPRFPFLGVHLSRDLHGHVECGPGAVLNLGRECYRKGEVDPADLLETLTYSGFLRLAHEHLDAGWMELKRSWSRRLFAASVARLLPGVTPAHLVAQSAGIRAQAVTPQGELVDDFLFAEGPHALHVINAPSPAATSSLAIGAHIARKYFTATGVGMAQSPG